MNKLYLRTEIHRKPSILLIGAGGTGSELLARLVKMHFRLLGLEMDSFDVSVVDFDTVSSANVGQQNFWPQDIGLNKAEVLVSRYNKAANLGWSFSKSEVCERSLPKLRQFDLIISCTDSPEFRWMMGGLDLGSTLWLDTGNDRTSGQVVLGNCRADKGSTYVPNVCDLFPSLETAKKIAGDSCSAAESLRRQAYGINESVASAAGRMIWELLRNSCIDYHMSMVDHESDIVEQKIAIDPQQWAMFGFETAQAA